jgi:predicted MPP superfamily phosphohydrolase
VGREDRSVSKRKPLQALMETVDHDSFVLTLDHQPCEYKENGKYGSDLVLSGHTHGGQLFPINYLQMLIPFNDGVYGRYQIDADTQAIVTAGFATWNYPSKTAAAAEYVIIDIRSK